MATVVKTATNSLNGPPKWTLNSQLLCAIQNSDIMAASKLFSSGVDTDTSFTISSIKRPALCLSAINNDIDMVRLMLRLGVSVNQCDSSGQTPLHIAFEHGFYSLAELLFNAKANPHIKNSSGQTVLHLAAKRGDIELMDLLLGSGVPLDYNERDCHLRSPLHLAARCGSPVSVSQLLQEGAEPSLQDGSGDTALHMAVYSAKDPLNTIKVLMEAYPEAALTPNFIKKTPLHCVITSCSSPKECLSLMLKMVPIGSGGPPETLSPRGCFGHTPLHLAVLERRFSLAKILIAAGTELDTRDQLGRTPLDCAVRDNCVKMVELLLAAGATCRRNSAHYDQSVTDPVIQKLLQNGQNFPLSLACLCRRTLSRSLGPILQDNLDKVPVSWRGFLSFKQL